MSASVITASSETDEIEENISDTSYDDSLCSEGITIFECMTIFYKTNKLQRMALFSCITC